MASFAANLGCIIVLLHGFSALSKRTVILPGCLLYKHLR